MITHRLFLRDQVTKKVTAIKSGPLPSPLPKKASLQLVPSGKVGSVQFVFNGKVLDTENGDPYIANGDNGTLAFQPLNDVEVKIFEKGSCTGKLLDAAEYQLTIARAPDSEHTLLKGLTEHFSAPWKKIGPGLRDAGAVIVRGWKSPDWNTPPTAKFFADVMDCKNAGLRTIACCTTPQPPKSIKQVKDWYARAFELGHAAVDLWEIGNEPNLNTVEAKRSESDAFWIGTLRSYFDQHLAPACEVLKDRGAQIIGGSISKDLQALANLVKFGLPQLVQFAGYHPYGFNPQEHVANCKGAYQICGPLGIAATEWNFHAGSPDQWVRGIGTCWAAAKAYLAMALYYRGEESGQPAGKLGIYDHDHNPRQPFYDTFKSLA